LLLVSMAAFGQSAERQVQSTNQKLENEFEREEVSPAQLDAFEERGVQKLADLAEYLEYISDESVNETFRLQAKQLALDLFVTADVPYKYYEGEEIIETTIDKYLKHLLQQKGVKTHFEFPGINTISEIEKTQDGTYFWLVQFVEKQEGDENTSARLVVTLKISLQKVIKQFGSETKFIWEVLLGEMVDLEVSP